MRTPFVSILVAALSVVSTACDMTEPDVSGDLVPKTVAEDPSLPSITLNGTRLHVITMGDPAKPVIVFLHGGPGTDSRSMLRLADRYAGYSLADDHFLLFWDQRGTGLSERVDKSQLNGDTYDADLDAIISRYSPNKPVTLIGQSWGGMYATKYIDGHPSRVSAAVLIESGPLTGALYEKRKNDIIKVDLFAEWLNDFAWGTQFIASDGDARMDYNLLLGLRGSQPGFHEREDFDPEPVWRLGAAAAHYIIEDGRDAHGGFTFDFTKHLAAYSTPVLFIAGALSDVLGPSLQREQMGAYPHASLEVIPDAGHDVHWTKPDRVVPLIQSYLDARKEGK